jgi:hypothetical protein
MRLASLVLSSAAALVSVSAASAADLPSKKAAPVDYVRICSIGSFTGFVIPGSDVCLKVGGFVRYNYSYTPQGHTFFYRPGVGGYAGATGFATSYGGQSAVGSLKLDARTTTEYGLLRSFADMRIDSAGGAAVDKASIQFGPWSFGKFQSFFDFYADAFSNITGLGSDNSVVGAAYTATFGNGFFLTVAIEDRYGTASAPAGFAGNFGAPAIAAPDAFGVGVAGTNGGLVTGGYRVPDLVAQFLYDPGSAGWGTAQLSAALHQVRTTGGLVTNSNETDYGWAVQGGVKFNVPALGAGDALYLQAAYTEGALSYIGANNTPLGFGPASQLVGYSDAVAIGTAGTVKLAKGYNVLAAYDHFWLPNFDTAIYAGYTKVDYSGGILTGATFSARDFGILQIGGQANWAPVSNLMISASVNWIQTDASSKPTDYIGGVKAVDTKSDAFQTLLRVQRDF